MVDIPRDGERLNGEKFLADACAEPDHFDGARIGERAITARQLEQWQALTRAR